MRQCPLCSATYDDGVEFCFVDGQPLVEAGAHDATPDIAAPAMPSSSGNMIPSAGMERVLQDIDPGSASDAAMEAPAPPPVAPPTPSPPPASTPASAPELSPPPAPPTPPRAPTVTPAQATPRPLPEGNFVPAPAADRGGRGRLLVAGIVVLCLLACLGLGGLGVVGSLSGGAAPPVAAPATTPPVEPAPAPAAAPAPAPEAPPEPRTVDLTSDPDGAEVWEGSELLCVTPCKVTHEPGAPLPRTFVFKRGGHEPREVVLEALGAPLRASLEKTPEPAPRPAPAAPRPSPRPAPAPAPAPVDDDDDLRMTR